ncbi:MAG: 23S rRNA (uracil(1939)-C(5))-methyltransferase RlmD [Lachnospiraceae bacterium]|nr:23S rRNA (uracil(1939)-C(5))-methyltransferase RlmD [Lachnospiraceae bacterium]
MKKGQEYVGIVERVDFPNKGIVRVEGEDKKVHLKDVLVGQKVRFMVTKTRKDKCEGRLLEVIMKAPNETAEPKCPKFGICGGCSYQTLPYEEQLKLKASQVKALLDPVAGDYTFEGIKGSPTQWEYRNKMEFSFGDEYKDGPLALGMHKKGSFYDIVNADECQLVDEDYRKIIRCTIEHMGARNIPYYHKMRHTGTLRHLLVRKAVKTGEILVDLVTSSNYVNMIDEGAATMNLPTAEQYLGLSEYVDKLLKLELKGKMVGILHTVNDSLADVVQNDETTLLYGQDYFYEELLGLKFKITPFSFFQTNSLGAEVLYETARSYVGETKDKLIFDLYSGTGTIAQMLAPVAKKVVGVEIIEEAVEAAKKNAELNGLTNCEFIAGDVLKMLDTIEDKPDLIVLDPPRDGIHPKALQKIINYGVDRMVYISCKPTSLARDLEILTAQGYKVEKACAVDMFCNAAHCETVCLLKKGN